MERAPLPAQSEVVAHVVESFNGSGVEGTVQVVGDNMVKFTPSAPRDGQQVVLTVVVGKSDGLEETHGFVSLAHGEEVFATTPMQCTKITAWSQVEQLLRWHASPVVQRVGLPTMQESIANRRKLLRAPSPGQ